MGKLRYECGASDAVYDLDARGGILSGRALPLRGSEWGYTLGRRSISSQRRRARTEDVETYFPTGAAADAFLAAVALDVESGEPGALCIGPEGAEWRQRAYMLGADPEDAYFGGSCALKLEWALMDGYWHRWLDPVELVIYEEGDPDSLWLDYNYEYPYDYRMPSRPASVRVEAAVGAWPRITFWGPCTSPAVKVGHNVYALDGVSVPSGGRAVIDSTSYSAYTVTLDGVRADATADARRGSGQGGGEYAFEQMPAGSLAVEWDGTFGVTIELCERRGDPPWSI